MKILVYGAGVVGSVYAAQLHQGGHDVRVLARGRRLANIQEHGIVLDELGSSGRQTFRVPPLEQLEPTEAYDLVMVLMQKGQVEAVLPVLAANKHLAPGRRIGSNPEGGSGEWGVGQDGGSAGGRIGGS
jgi:2-dehydropantoate 2-reductase